MCTDNYSNKERFDKVITKIKWCSFSASHCSSIPITVQAEYKNSNTCNYVRILRSCFSFRRVARFYFSTTTLHTAANEVMRSTKPQCSTACHLLCTRTTLTGHVRRLNALKFMTMKLRTSHCSFALAYCHYNLYKYSFVLRWIFDGAY